MTSDEKLRMAIKWARAANPFSGELLQVLADAAEKTLPVAKDTVVLFRHNSLMNWQVSPVMAYQDALVYQGQLRKSGEYSAHIMTARQ